MYDNPPTLIQNIHTTRQWFGEVLQHRKHSYVVQMLCTKDGRPFPYGQTRVINHYMCRRVDRLPERYEELYFKTPEKPVKRPKKDPKGFLQFGRVETKEAQLRASGKYPFLYALDYLRYQCSSEHPLTKAQAYDMIYSLCFTDYDREAGTLRWDRNMVKKFADRRVEWLVLGMLDNGDE